MRRPYKRVKRYPANLNIPMSLEMREALEAAADAADIAVAEMGRRAISSGLSALGNSSKPSRPQHDAPGLGAANDGSAWTPLHWAALAGNAATVEALIGVGGDIAAQEGGWTPLHAAALAGNPAAVAALARCGADVDTRDETGSTPLHWAALAGNAEVIETLIGVGADPSVADGDGKLPFDRVHENLSGTTAYRQLEQGRWRFKAS